MAEQTPMMRQYTRLKERYHNAILFFRLGDFYEMFRSDAEEASRLLGLTLTQRQGIPMCGIPYHAARGYIGRLLAAGRKVAICEQTNVTGRGLADREVVEVITPGTVTEEDYLDRRHNNYIAALCAFARVMVLCYSDVSTGEVVVGRFNADDAASLRAELYRISPRELLVQQSLADEDSDRGAVVRSQTDVVIDRIPDWNFDVEAGYERLCRLFDVVNLKGFGLDADNFESAPAGVLIQYLEENTGGRLAHINRIERRNDTRYVVLDESTQVNLELVRGGVRGGYSLRETVDETCTAMGSRAFARRLLAPLTDPAAIDARLDAVEALYHHQTVLSDIRRSLDRVADLERLTARVAMRRAHAKDLKAIGRSLHQAEELEALLSAVQLRGVRPQKLALLPGERYELLCGLAEELDEALVDNPATAEHEGNMIRPEFDEELSRLHRLRDDGQSLLNELVEEEREACGIPSLKLKYNRVIGYFFEVPKTRAEDVPEHFVRRQSTSNAERFSSSRLSELQREVAQAEEQAIECERELFVRLRERVAGFHADLSTLAEAIATVDVHASNAYTATVRGYCRPELIESRDIEVIGGRHPVVEAHLPDGEFVPNDLDLRDDHFVLLTGPNMAGKSTYLRQNALIVLLAQTGAFVPAERAAIGIADRIFCRVGASDNLARGESTFLVEMNETSNILRFATAHSLVIMDEVGRGTGTEDGISIAQAVSEYLLTELGSRTLFATHYHELTALDLPGLRTMRMAVSEGEGQVVFLKQVESGPSHRSYGVHVARLAGLPPPVVRRAEQILAAREESTVYARHSGDGAEADLPSPHQRETTPDGQQALFSDESWLPDEIRSLDLSNMTPVQAIALLDQWQRLLSEK